MSDIFNQAENQAHFVSEKRKKGDSSKALARRSWRH